MSSKYMNNLKEISKSFYRNKLKIPKRWFYDN